MSDLTSEPVSRLRWYPKRGFELDLNASVDDITLTLVAVPLPVDGTVELRDGELTLDPLEILFKAQVDIDGAPGQLTRGTLLVERQDHGEQITLSVEIEDAETGERRDLTLRVPVQVPTNAPEAGGPRPRPKDESELDWDDEDTIEAYFKDPLTQEDPLPVAGRRGLVDNDDEGDEDPPVDALGKEIDPEQQERGFNRLLQALLREGPEPGEIAEPDGPDAEIIPLARDPADARGLLQYLIDHEQLELEPDHDVDELVAGAAPILASAKPPDARAQALSGWLFTQDAVAELYIDDDALASLIAQW